MFPMGPSVPIFALVLRPSFGSAADICREIGVSTDTRCSLSLDLLGRAMNSAQTIAR